MYTTTNTGTILSMHFIASISFTHQGMKLKTLKINIRLNNPKMLNQPNTDPLVWEGIVKALSE